MLWIGAPCSACDEGAAADQAGLLLIEQHDLDRHRARAAGQVAGGHHRDRGAGGVVGGGRALAEHAVEVTADHQRRAAVGDRWSARGARPGSCRCRRRGLEDRETEALELAAQVGAHRRRAR
jgi:hypothetical protein